MWLPEVLLFLEKERFSEAFRHFVMLMKKGLKPNVLCFVNVFLGCKGCL